MANFEEMRQHNLKEERTQARLDEMGVPKEGEERVNGECENCGGPITERFYRYHEVFMPSWNPYPDHHDIFNRPRTIPWSEDGGEWRSIHELKDCVKHLRSLIA